MSYSTLGIYRDRGRRVPVRAVPVPAFKKLFRPITAIPIREEKHPYQGTPIIAQPVPQPVPQPIRCACPVNGLGLDPTLSQLAKFMENYKDYVLAFSPATNTIAAYSRGMSKVAFTIQLNRNEPVDAGLSKARAIINGQAGVSGLGNMFNDMGRNANLVAASKAKPKASAPPVDLAQRFNQTFASFNPHNAWGNRYSPAPYVGFRSGNGRSQGTPFYAQGMHGVTPIVLDPPIEQQEIRFDAPSLTIYMGSNKIALIPALLSALAVKVILMGGSKVATATSFWKASDKAAKKMSRA